MKSQLYSLSILHQAQEQCLVFIVNFTELKDPLKEATSTEKLLRLDCSVNIPVEELSWLLIGIGVRRPLWVVQH